MQRPVWDSTGHRGNYELVALCPGCVRHRCDDGERWRTVSLAQVEQWMQQWVHNSDSDKVQRMFCLAHPGEVSGPDWYCPPASARKLPS